MSDAPERTTSEEVDRRQLELAAREGEAYREALEYMTTEVADAGDAVETGDYLVGFAQESAEGMYEMADDGRLEFRDPGEENCHLEVAVADAADGRFLPYVDVRATLTAADGERVGPVEVPYVWHPGLHHYGTNLSIPGDGTYDVAVEAEPPSFGRHDRENGDRFAEPIDVVFEDVELTTGRG